MYERLWKKRMLPGFTLFELLAVIAILAIVATASAVFYGSVRVRQRDAKRIADVGQIAKAMEIYYATHGLQYPTCSGQVKDCVPLLDEYLDPAAIDDPTGTVDCTVGSVDVCEYAFQGTPGSQYTVFFYLEEPLSQTGQKCNRVTQDGIRGCL